MSQISFTVPLTARVLRAILADMEGTGSLLAACGCSQGVQASQPMPEPMWTGTKAWAQLAGKVIDAGQGIIREMPGVNLNEMDYDAIDHLCNEFDYGFAPISVDPQPFTVTQVLTPQPITEPFILTPEGVVPVAEGVDPFLLQVAAPIPMPPTTVPTPPVPAPPVTTTTVPLDGEGLPWDGRIHASTKTFRMSDNTWKLKKGADPALVEAVKAELRGCMAAPAPAAPVAPAQGVMQQALTGAMEVGAHIGMPAAPSPTALNIQPPSAAFAEVINAAHPGAVPVPPVAGPGSIAPNYSGTQSGGYEPPVTVPEVPVAPVQPVTIISQQDVTKQSIPLVPEVPEVPAAPTAITFTDFCTWFTTKMTSGVLVRAQLEKVCADNGITSLPMLQNRPDLVPVIHAALVAIGGE